MLTPAIGWELLKIYARARGNLGQTKILETTGPCFGKKLLEGTVLTLGTFLLILGIIGFLGVFNLIPIGLSNTILIPTSIAFLAIGGIMTSDAVAAYLLERLVKKKMFPSLSAQEYTYEKWIYADSNDNYTTFYSLYMNRQVLCITVVHSEGEAVQAVEEDLIERGYQLKQGCVPASEEYFNDDSERAFPSLKPGEYMHKKLLPQKDGDNKAVFYSRSSSHPGRVITRVVENEGKKIKQVEGKLLAKGYQLKAGLKPASDEYKSSWDDAAKEINKTAKKKKKSKTVDASEDLKKTQKRKKKHRAKRNRKAT